MPRPKRRFDVFLDPTMHERLDRWAAEQTGRPGLAPAVRLLLSEALAAEARRASDSGPEATATPPKRRCMLRLAPEMIDELDAWRRRQPGRPSRSEAIRRLLSVSLDGLGPSSTAGEPPVK
ncbi:MAG TPA: hypothetical protein VKS60_22025 [Stellaceae bacterium]|nr:hypothetical protein [Stellaceae bacterium]